MLFDVAPHDLSVLAAVTVTLLAAAAAACCVPAHRATRVDPMIALREG